MRPRPRPGAAAVVRRARRPPPWPRSTPPRTCPPTCALVRDVLARAPRPRPRSPTPTCSSPARRWTRCSAAARHGRARRGRAARAPGSPAARARGGRVRSAGSPVHTRRRAPDAALLGLLRVGAADRDRAAALAGRLARPRERPPTGLRRAPATGRRPTCPRCCSPRWCAPARTSATPTCAALFWARPRDAAEAVGRTRARIALHDEERRAAALGGQGHRRLLHDVLRQPRTRKYVARWCARRGLTPNQVTERLACCSASLAAAAFATGERWGLVAGAVLLQVAFTLRLRRRPARALHAHASPSSAPGWTRSSTARKEYVVFAGPGDRRRGQTGDPVWAARRARRSRCRPSRHARRLLLPAVRAPRRRCAAARARRRSSSPATTSASTAAWLRPPPLPRPSARRRRAGAWSRAWRAVADGSAAAAASGSRRTLMFPIGERFAVISLTAALCDAADDLHRPARLGRRRRVYGLGRSRVLRARIARAAAPPAPTATTGPSPAARAPTRARLPPSLLRRSRRAAAGRRRSAARRLEPPSPPASRLAHPARRRSRAGARPTASLAVPPLLRSREYAALLWLARSPAGAVPPLALLAAGASATTTSSTACATSGTAAAARRRGSASAGTGALAARRSCCWLVGALPGGLLRRRRRCSAALFVGDARARAGRP